MIIPSTSPTPATRAEVEKFFNRVVLDYNCGDVRELLREQMRLCGPLLASVVNGIDLIGGMMDGFRRGNSSSRSELFLTTFLAMPPGVARLVYKMFRCGLSHEGVSKLGTCFFTSYTIRDPELLYVLDGQVVTLDVTELARRFVAAVDAIALDVHRYLRFVPVDDPNDIAALTRGRRQSRSQRTIFCAEST